MYKIIEVEFLPIEEQTVKVPIGTCLGVVVTAEGAVHVPKLVFLSELGCAWVAWVLWIRTVDVTFDGPGKCLDTYSVGPHVHCLFRRTE